MFARKKLLFSSLALTTFMAVSAAAQNAATPISLTRNYNFPVIGLAGTETLQVNVANLATVPAGSSLVGACVGTISFTNASGNAIGTPVKFTVGAGQIFSTPLPFAKTGYSSRGEILASVQTVSFSTGSLCSLATSLETFDTNTGITHVVLSVNASGPVPLFYEIPPGVSEHP